MINKQRNLLKQLIKIKGKKLKVLSQNFEVILTHKKNVSNQLVWLEYKINKD